MIRKIRLVVKVRPIATVRRAVSFRLPGSLRIESKVKQGTDNDWLFIYLFIYLNEENDLGTSLHRGIL